MDRQIEQKLDEWIDSKRDRQLNGQKVLKIVIYIDIQNKEQIDGQIDLEMVG